ncbi:Pre-mRNA-splicing factor ATP-dependent RNA helicase-like protein [Venturia inaequalis]|nr:Pre-mRNA-splicing factor ATP-dependent RNA helicase-like protein [Venturia inaequalis]
MPSKRLPVHQPRSKRQKKLLLLLEVLLHIALAELIRSLLHHLITIFPQRYWLVIVIPLCLLICDEFLRVWFMQKTKVPISHFQNKTMPLTIYKKQIRSTLGHGRVQITVPKLGQGGRWQHRGESRGENRARLVRMQKLIDEKNAELGVAREK